MPETPINNDNLLSGRQEVLSMDAIEDVIIVMVCTENSNIIDNGYCTNMSLPGVFHDHESEYAATKENARTISQKKISRLVNYYLS